MSEIGAAHFFCQRIHSSLGYLTPAEFERASGSLKLRMPWFPPKKSVKSVQFYGTTTSLHLFVMTIKAILASEGRCFGHFQHPIGIRLTDPGPALIRSQGGGSAVLGCGIRLWKDFGY